MSSPMGRRRLLAALLVVLALATLAPRTSQHLDNGWEVVVMSDTSGRASSVSSLTFWAMPPNPVPLTSRIPVFISADHWHLIAAPSGCTQVTDAVVCTLNRDTIRRKHLITISVRSSGPLSYSFVAPSPDDIG